LKKDEKRLMPGAIKKSGTMYKRSF
jgi:hypothetical protein